MTLTDLNKQFREADKLVQDQRRGIDALQSAINVLNERREEMKKELDDLIKARFYYIQKIKETA
jgi:hypothetical protein